MLAHMQSSIGVGEGSVEGGVSGFSERRRLTRGGQARSICRIWAAWSRESCLEQSSTESSRQHVLQDAHIVVWIEIYTKVALTNSRKQLVDKHCVEYARIGEPHEYNTHTNSLLPPHTSAEEDTQCI